MTRDANTAFARALVDEWARANVRFATLAPGSRSTPLALALAADGRIRLEVFLDERSASFCALGAAKASGIPTVVVTTSGTGAVNVHPAVVEADRSQVPMLVCTADRPPELRGTGAGQAIDQQDLYGGSVRRFVDPGPPEDRPRSGVAWRSLAARAVIDAAGPPAGPVHLNLPFREPLVPTGAPLVEAPGRPGGASWHRCPRRAAVAPADAELAAAAELLGAARGVVVAGWGTRATPPAVARFAAARGWPVLADPLSGLRTTDDTVAAYETILRVESVAEELRPDVVLQLGSTPTSRGPAEWLDTAAARVVLADLGEPPDPGRRADLVLASDPDTTLSALSAPARPPDPAWATRWHELDRRAAAAVEATLSSWPEPFEGGVARDVAAALPDGATLVVASSMPVRDLEAFARPRTGLRVLANRGANGIDGFVSTVLGVATASDGATVGLLGDLALLHDSNGLLGAADRGLDATLVVVDNDGGGIFSFLPHAHAAEARPHFEVLFGTPHGRDLPALAAVHDIPATTVARADDVMPTVRRCVDAGGVRMVVVRSDRELNVARHAAVVDAVRRAIATA